MRRFDQNYLENHLADMVQFEAMEQMVTILPLVDRPGEELGFVTHNLGEFRKHEPMKVPLWCAIMLEQSKRCKIEKPVWMTPEHFHELADLEEQQSGGSFQIMGSEEYPDREYYVEITTAFLKKGDDFDSTFGALERNNLRQAVERLREVRSKKIVAGLAQFDQMKNPHLEVTGLTKLEIEQIRYQSLASMDMHRHMMTNRGVMIPYEELLKAQEAYRQNHSQSQVSQNTGASDSFPSESQASPAA